MTGVRHVALVSEHASPLAALGGADAGGQNVYVASLAGALADLGCLVTVYTRRDSTSLPSRVPLVPGVVVEHVDAGPPQQIPKDELFPHMAAFAEHLCRTWRRRPPRVVHAHFWMSGMASLQAVRSMARSIPMIQTFHALGTVKRRHQGAADTSPVQRDATERVLARNVDRVVATCTDEVHELVALGADPARVRVVPCGVDPAFVPEGPAAARVPGLRRVVVVSRLVPRKGVDDVIRALAGIDDVELVVAGGPPAPLHRHDPEVRRLQRVATRAGVMVDFRGGLPRAEVAALMRSADVVACTPWYEPFGIVPVEAMACGVPVVGSAVGGLLDTIVDGRTGLLVPPRDPLAVRRAIEALLEDLALRRRLGRAAAARADRRYRWELVARETLGVYDETAAAGALENPAVLA